jgi:hypothetical protein
MKMSVGGRCLVCLVTGASLAVAAVTARQSAGPVQKPQSLATLGVPEHVNSTPSLAVSGRTVIVVWTATRGTAVNVYLAASSDGGTTFAEPRRVNDRDGDVSANNEQPPRAAISGPAGKPTLTVLWSKRDAGSERTRRDEIWMARSTDGGRTFSPARTTHDQSFSGARGWESLAASSDGRVHAVWLDGRDAERKMADAAAHTGMAHKGLPPQDIYHGSIAPDGRVVESLIATGVCFCCKTAVAVDGRGSVYAAWRHIFAGSMRDIAFARSTDAGSRFGPLVRVSEDNWELNGCPEDGPALGVDQAGTIHVAWTTLITDREQQKALFYATSKDGTTFSPRARVPTDGVTNPGHPQLALTGNGVALVWDEIVNRVRRVSIGRSARGELKAPEVLSGSESASHPVIARSGNDLLVAWTSRASTATSASDPSQIRLTRVRID